MDVGEAKAVCHDILEDLEVLPEAAEEFVESVQDKVLGIMETVEVTDRVTVGQRIALENMRGGVDRWLGV